MCSVMMLKKATHHPPQESNANVLSHETHLTWQNAWTDPGSVEYMG